MATFYTDTASFNSLTVTGSTVMSASANTSALQLIGSGSTILSVSGSGGSIFSITDTAATNLILFSVSTGSINILSVDSLKKVSISGSLVVTGSITGSLFGTASFASTASNIFPAITNNVNNYVLTATGSGTINGESNLVFTGTNLGIGKTSPTVPLDVLGNTNLTGSLSVSGSTTIRGTTTITGSLLVSGSLVSNGNTTITGSLTVSSSTAQFLAQAGTLTNPAYSFSNDTNTGFRGVGSGGTQYVASGVGNINFYGDSIRINTTNITIRDTAANHLLGFRSVNLASNGKNNYIRLANADTGSATNPRIELVSSATDTNISLDIVPLGTGSINLLGNTKTSGSLTITGSLILTGSISMSLATGTPSSIVSPSGYYRATINGAAVFIPFYNA